MQEFKNVYKMTEFELKQQQTHVLVTHIIRLKEKIARMKWDGMDCSCGKKHVNPYSFDSRSCINCKRPLCGDQPPYFCSDCYEICLCRDCNVKCHRCETRVCGTCIQKNYPDWDLTACRGDFWDDGIG